MRGVAATVLLCGALALVPAAAPAMPPAAKQYLPVIPTANGPAAVRNSAPQARPDQLSPSARSSLRGKSGSELRSLATATALGAPARVNHRDSSRVQGDSPGFVSATFDALGQGAVLALLAGFALLAVILAVVARSRRRIGSGTPTT